MPDPISLADRLRQEREVIKGAPISFVSACFVILVASLATCGGLFCWHYSGVISEKDATIEKQRISIDACEKNNIPLPSVNPTQRIAPSAQSHLTPDEERQWALASTDYEQGKLYRDTTNWVTSARFFEEAYTLAFAVSLKHPECCNVSARNAGNLSDLYRKLNRPGDAIAAAQAQVALQIILNEDFTLNPSAPCLTPAIELFGRLSKKKTN